MLTPQQLNEAVDTSAAFRRCRALQPAGGRSDKVFPPATRSGQNSLAALPPAPMQSSGSLPVLRSPELGCPVFQWRRSKLRLVSLQVIPELKMPSAGPANIYIHEPHDRDDSADATTAQQSSDDLRQRFQ